MASNADWRDLMGSYGQSILEQYGDGHYDGFGPNPVTKAIQAGHGLALVHVLYGGSEMALSVAATCCQMMKFNRENGPEGDRKPKALRRHWYAWYKGEFAQPLAFALKQYERTAAGVYQIDDRKWSSLISKTYGKLVDTGLVTYKDLWVEDASRMIGGTGMQLFQRANIVVAVEKDSLFADFMPAAKALGAKVLVSGKGKQSKAATEKMLRDFFWWAEDRQPFHEEEPLRVIHVSDYDYDGESVIGPTFGEQARRYTDDVDEARIGIVPEQVPTAEWEQRSYKIKVSHQGSKDWAAEKAIFSAKCDICNRQFLVVGSDMPECPNCGALDFQVTLDRKAPAGFEVEALKTREFYPYFVDALLELVSWEEIIWHLRAECLPDIYGVARRLADELLQDNGAYQDALADLRELQDRVEGFRDRAEQHIRDEAEPRQNDYRGLEDDPEPEDFREHLRGASDWTGAWRPFSVEVRDAALTDDLRQDERVQEILDWQFE